MSKGLFTKGEQKGLILGKQIGAAEAKSKGIDFTGIGSAGHGISLVLFAIVVLILVIGGWSMVANILSLLKGTGGKISAFQLVFGAFFIFIIWKKLNKK